MTTSAKLVTTVSSEADEEDDVFRLPLPWLAIVIVCIIVAIVTAVGGNLLIILSYKRDYRLRNVHNLYLLHLAVCDLFIGAISMPCYLLYTVLYWTWPLGSMACKLFLVEDFWMCAMSTMIVVLASWDRLALIKMGASYARVQTKRGAYIKLTLCWIFSFLLYSPAIILWDVVRGYSVIPPDECDVEFYEDVAFVLTTEIISFPLPFIALIIINTILFVALRRISRAYNFSHHGQQQHRQLNRDKSTIDHADLTARVGYTGSSCLQPQPLNVQPRLLRTREGKTIAERSTNTTENNTDPGQIVFRLQATTSQTDASDIASLSAANSSATAYPSQPPTASPQPSINLFTGSPLLQAFSMPSQIPTIISPQPSTDHSTAASLFQASPTPSEIPTTVSTQPSTNPPTESSLIQASPTPSEITATASPRPSTSISTAPFRVHAFATPSEIPTITFSQPSANLSNETITTFQPSNNLSKGTFLQQASPAPSEITTLTSPEPSTNLSKATFLFQAAPTDSKLSTNNLLQPPTNLSTATSLLQAAPTPPEIPTATSSQPSMSLPTTNSLLQVASMASDIAAATFPEPSTNISKSTSLFKAFFALSKLSIPATSLFKRTSVASEIYTVTFPLASTNLFRTTSHLQTTRMASEISTATSSQSSTNLPKATSLFQTAPTDSKNFNTTFSESSISLPTATVIFPTASKGPISCVAGDRGKAKQNDSSRSRERRMAYILMGLVVAMLIFWAPYSILTIIISSCNDCIDENLYKFFTWFVWIKSCVNPFLYAFNSPRFRKNFGQLLAPVLLSRFRRKSFYKCSEKEPFTV